MKQIHFPVMYQEIVKAFSSSGSKLFVDCTLGMGGHTMEILRSIADSRVIGLDVDRESLKIAEKNLESYKGRVEFLNLNYTDLFDMYPEKVKDADGILIDPGISMFQLKSDERGFSHSIDSVLDMRKDRSSGITAAEFLNSASEKELLRVFRDYGNCRKSYELARAVIEQRLFAKFRTSSDLKKVVEKVYPARPLKGRAHPAAMVFQALRIHVNRELSGVDEFIAKIPDHMKEGAVIAFLTFHSTEDRIVKRAFRDLHRKHRIEIVKPFPGFPSEEETERNSASKPAKLRVGRVI